MITPTLSHPITTRPVAAKSLVSRHMPSLDSIRGGAILMVVLYHGFGSYGWQAAFGMFWGTLAAAAVSCGRFGVNVFFVLSGFLITTLLFKARERQDYYRNFYIRRALRILPIYLAVLALVWGLGIISNRFLAAALLFIANFSQLFGAPMRQFGLLWSLAVEEHFYFLWPTCVRRLTERTLILILVSVLAVEPLLRLLAIHLLAHIDIHYKTPFVLDYIAYGALLATLVQQGRIHTGNAGRVGRALLLVGGPSVLLVIVLLAFHAGKSLDALEDLPFTWVGCGILLLGLARDHDRLTRTGRTDSRGVLAFYGYISYGLYLINTLVYASLGGWIIRHLAPERLHSLAVWSGQALACISAATAIAYLSRRYFEGPILGWKGRWQSAKKGKPA